VLTVNMYKHILCIAASENGVLGCNGCDIIHNPGLAAMQWFQVPSPTSSTTHCVHHGRWLGNAPEFQTLCCFLMTFFYCLWRLQWH